MPQAQAYPDLEIYLLKPDQEALLAWLNSLFTHLQPLTEGRWQADYQGQRLEIQITPKAEKNFTCLWFKTNHTPWPTDLECARTAHAALGVEVRCQASAWLEEEGETAAGWIKLIQGVEKPFSWF